jgi:hypothetical protein
MIACIAVNTIAKLSLDDSVVQIAVAVGREAGGMLQGALFLLGMRPIQHERARTLVS